MKYHAPTGGFSVTPEQLKRASNDLLWAIAKVRSASGMPPEPHETCGRMTDAEHAEQAILDAAKELGIDLGAERHGQLDVRAHG